MSCAIDGDELELVECDRIARFVDVVLLVGLGHPLVPEKIPPHSK